MSISSTVNGVDLERLNATVEAVTADPGLGRFQFRARNHWIDGGHSRTTIQGFYGAGQEDTTRDQPFVLDSDEPPVLLGENRAPNAGEYALQALAACLTGTIVYHAAARGMALQGLECTVQATWTCRGSSVWAATSAPATSRSRSPSRSTGDFDDDQLAEIASLTRYSPVRDTVTNPVPSPSTSPAPEAIRMMSAPVFRRGHHAPGTPLAPRTHQGGPTRIGCRPSSFSRRPRAAGDPTGRVGEPGWHVPWVGGPSRRRARPRAASQRRKRIAAAVLWLLPRRRCALACAAPGAEGARRHVGLATEVGGEVGRVVEAQCVGDLRDRARRRG